MTIRIPHVVLPEGYDGKLLLVLVKATGIDDTIILRSGDQWHREILRNTEAEIEGLGFDAVSVCEMGGAWAKCDEDGSVTLYGGSDEYGACDKEHAAMLLRRHFPGRTIRVEE